MIVGLAQRLGTFLVLVMILVRLLRTLFDVQTESVAHVFYLPTIPSQMFGCLSYNYA